MNIVVFVSGNGTTLQSIIDSIDSRELHSEIVLVVSSNDKAYGLERARQADIDTYVIKNSDPSEMDEELLQILDNYDVDLIVLAGYLKMIGKKLIDRYSIINTHPSLLPKFGGKGMYGMNIHRAVIEAKEEYSGATVHYVDDKCDEGKIIKQTKLKILPDDTAETLSQKIQEIEKRQLIEILKEFE